MKRDVFLATFSDDAVNVIKKYGIGMEFNHFCISESLNEENFEATLASMELDRIAAGATGTGQTLAHGPFTEVCPQAIDPLFVELAMKRVNQAYEGCRRLGVNRMVVHSGFIPAIYFPVWHVERSVEFWSRFMEDKPKDFHIYIENVLDPDPEPLAKIASEIGDERVKLCLDVGHANAASDPAFSVYDWIRIMGPYLGHFHLHNNDGTGDQHLPLTEGTMDMGKVLRTIDDECSPKATLTVESRICDDSIAWLLEQMA